MYSVNLFGFIFNNPIGSIDLLGRLPIIDPNHFSPFTFTGFQKVSGLHASTGTVAQAKHSYYDSLGNSKPMLGEEMECMVCVNGKFIEGRKFPQIEWYKGSLWIEYDAVSNLDSRNLLYDMKGNVVASNQKYTIAEHELRHLDNYVEAIRSSVSLINNAGGECIPSKCSAFMKEYINARLQEYEWRRNRKNVLLHHEDYPKNSPFFTRPSIEGVAAAQEYENERRVKADSAFRQFQSCMSEYIQK